PPLIATGRNSSSRSLDFLARALDRSPKKRGQFLYLTSLEMSSSKCSVHQPITTVRPRDHFGACHVFSMSLAWIVERLSLREAALCSCHSSQVDEGSKPYANSINLIRFNVLIEKALRVRLAT